MAGRRWGRGAVLRAGAAARGLRAAAAPPHRGRHCRLLPRPARPGYRPRPRPRIAAGIAAGGGKGGGGGGGGRRMAVQAAGRPAMRAAHARPPARPHTWPRTPPRGRPVCRTRALDPTRVGAPHWRLGPGQIASKPESPAMGRPCGSPPAPPPPAAGTAPPPPPAARAASGARLPGLELETCPKGPCRPAGVKAPDCLRNIKQHPARAPRDAHWQI